MPTIEPHLTPINMGFIRVNNQWRICFVWQSPDAYDVRFCDYH